MPYSIRTADGRVLVIGDDGRPMMDTAQNRQQFGNLQQFGQGAQFAMQGDTFDPTKMYANQPNAASVVVDTAVNLATGRSGGLTNQAAIAKNPNYTPPGMPTMENAAKPPSLGPQTALPGGGRGHAGGMPSWSPWEQVLNQPKFGEPGFSGPVSYAPGWQGGANTGDPPIRIEQQPSIWWGGRTQQDWQNQKPWQVNPAVWDSMGDTGRQLSLGFLEKAGWDPNDYQRQINATRPMGQAPRSVQTQYAQPRGAYR